MLKFITKKVIRRGSGSKKSDKSANDGPTGANVLFEFTDANVSKFSDLLEVAVRSKISNKSSEPLRIVEDEATDRLVSDFKNGSISKYQLESYSPSSLWSAAVQVLRDSKPVFEEDKCNTLRSANYDDVSQLARSLPQHSQKLIGVLCASAEMLIRADSTSAPMVLNSLSNSIIWSLPLNSFVTTNALVNLIVDHRALFPSCHTFARKISTSFLPISPEEWRVLAKNSASIYAHQDGHAEDIHNENASDSDTDSQAKRGPKSHNNNANNNSSLGVPKPAGAGGDRLSLIAQGRGAGASNDNSGINNKSKPWRSTYTDELPLNDVNASASIDVSARLGLKPSAEPTLSKTSNSNNNTSTPATTKSSIASSAAANSSEGKLTLKDLQGVFSSSLVSAASLDFLRVNTVVADDYADTKTLSSTVKWILQAQELSDILLSASKSGVGANKGIISWAEFLLLADPFLRAPDRNYMRAHKTKYNQAINVPVEDEENSGSGSGGDSRESSSKATAGHKAEAKDAAGILRSSLSQSQQKDNNRNNNSKLRSRGSFKSSSSSSDEQEQDSDSDNAKYKNNNKIKQGQQQQQQQARNVLTSSRDTAPTSRFASNKGSAASTSYRDDHDVADLEEVEEMELAEDPRRVSNNNNNNSKGNNIRGSNSYKRSNSSDSEEGEETDRRYSNTASTNNNNSKGNRVSQFDNNINRRRQWEDPDVTDDNISITSGVKTAPVRRVSGNVSTSFGASALTRQTSQNKNSVFDLDLLDDSVASIPLMNDPSRSFEKPSNNNAHTKHSSALNKSVDRGMPMHNSFDDVSSSDEDHRRAVVVGKQQRESPIEDGPDNANNNDRPLSSSFVSDSDEADSFKMPPRHTNTHFTAQAGAGAGASVNRSHQSVSADRSLLANSFDEEDEDEQHHSDGEEEKEGRESREQKHHTQPPLVGRSNSHIQQQQQEKLRDIDQENEHDTEGGLDGAPPIKKKTGVKKFMKMFSLTSTSASSKSSVNNSQTSSVNGSPLRHRANSNESEHTVNSLNTSTLDNTTLNAAAPKSKSMFGRMKSSVSKPFKSGSTSSNKDGVSGSGKSDAGSETGSQISAADYAALHADRAERGRLDSIDSTDSAQINAHSALDDSTGGPSGKVKKNMLGRITSKMSKPFKSTSSNRSDAGSEAGSQISGTENIAEQYRDQQRDTADSKKMAKEKAAIATTTAATTAAVSVPMAERDRADSLDSESHLDGAPSGKVKKNMLGRITSKMSKPFKASNSSNRSDAGSETGSQASAVEYAAILDERTSHSSGIGATAGAMGATERARGNSLDSTDSAQINNESHLEGAPSGKVKKNMLGRITSKMSKPFKSSNSSNRSDAGSETGSHMSTADHAAVASDLAASGTAATTVPPASAKPFTTPTTTSATTPTTGAVAVASPPKPPKPIPSTVPAKAAISAPAPGPGPALTPAPAGPKYASYASALAHQPTDTSDRARASSFDSTDSANNAHIEGLPSSSGTKDTDSAVTKPKKSVLGRVASKMSKPFKAGTNKSESNKSDNGSEVGSQISEQEKQPTIRAAPDRSALVSSQGSAPLTAAALNQHAISSDTAPASGPHSQLPLPRLERVSSLDSTSTHDQTGQPKLKKGMFGRITSKLSKPFKSGKSGTSSAGSAHDGEEMSETGSQISTEEHTPPSTSTAAPEAPSRTHLTSLKQPVSVMESVDLDSPVSGRVGSSGKYSIGIADSARDSHDHDAYSSSNTPDSVPIFTNTAASPTTIANVSSSRLPPTPRTVSRTNRAASDAASEEGSVNSAHTHETTSSTGSKKGKPTLKGMMHKSYKVVFQGNKKGSALENAGDEASVASTGAAPPAPTTTAATANSTTVDPPEKPAKLPFRFKKAGERQAVEEVAADNVGTHKSASPPKPVKPTALSASHGSHPMPHVSHLNPVPQPTSPTIYSAEDIIAGMHSAAPASRPLPAVPATNTNNDVTASQSDVITADRRLSNPALNKKRSSFSLGGLFGFGSSGSKENSRNSSRAPSRSNSFNGDADLTNAAAAGGGIRESVSHRPHSTRDPSPQRSFNGTGLAALLRGQVPSPSPLNGRFVDRSESTPMSPLTPTTPYMTQSYDTNFGFAANNQEEQAALEMSNVLLESSRLASQNILDRVQVQQSKFTETHQHPHTVNVLADLQQIKQKRAKSQDRARVSSHHHRHLDDHNRIGSDLDDSDIEDQDGNTSVSSPAQRKLLLDWKSIVSRRAPQSVFLTSDSLAEMRQLVRTSRGDDVQVDLIALDDADEDAIHRQKRRMMSTVPDPLFGLSLHDKAALSHLRLTKSLKHSSNHSQNASLSLKPVNAADLTTAQLNKLVQENAFYSELDLAMGVKFSGQLSRVVSRFWRHRYFVLMVEPLINPNLFPQGRPKEESVPASAPLSPHSPFVRSSSLHIDTSAVDNTMDSTPSPIPDPVLVAPTDPTATASGPVPGKYQYFLLEYERCVSSRWGDVPVRLLKRYPAGDILALRTDTRAHKKGLEFTVILRRNTSTAPTSGTANESTKTTMGDGTVGKVSMQDFPSPLSKQPSAATGQSVKNNSGEEPEPAKGLKSLVKKAQPGSRFAAVVKAEQKAQQAQQATNAVSAEPSVSTTAPAPAQTPAQTPAPIVTGQEEPPVIETRWTRLLRRNSSKKENLVADTAASAPPTLPPPVTVATSQQPNSTSAGDNSANAAAIDEEKQNEEEEDPSEDEKVDESDLEEEGEIDDNDSLAATSVGGGSEFGDFYYRDGTLPPGVNEADLRSGKKINKKDFIKLKLKAPTPDERLQWVQIIHSIAAPTMYINTTSY